MILHVDPRAGSGDLAQPLLARGLPVQSTALEYGDFAWMGRGPEGRPVSVAVELKTVEDVLSCITSGRFAGHQLPGLQATYEVIYLIVEGRWTVGPERELLTLYHGRFQAVEWSGRKWKYEALSSWITTMEVKAGLRVRRSLDKAETVQMIHDLYSWWTGAPYEAHRSHLVTYLGGTLAERVYTMQASTLARGLMAMVKGLSETKARAVAAEYGCIKVLADATAADIAKKVDGIGLKLAERICDAMWSVK